MNRREPERRSARAACDSKYDINAAGNQLWRVSLACAVRTPSDEKEKPAGSGP
jgi:hypothetical protein